MVDHGREGVELLAEDREEPTVCLSAQLVPRLPLPLQRHGPLPRHLRDLVDVVVAHADVPRRPGHRLKSEIPPDLVVKFQPIKIVDITLEKILCMRLVSQREIKG